MGGPFFVYSGEPAFVTFIATIMLIALSGFLYANPGIRLSLKGGVKFGLAIFCGSLVISLGITSAFHSSGYRLLPVSCFAVLGEKRCGK